MQRINRFFVLWGVLLSFSFVYFSCKTTQESGESKKGLVYSHPMISTPDSALNFLKVGNERFVKDSVLPDQLGVEKRKDLIDHGQHPFAVIVTCSDSRVAPEILFDQGLGDIFVIRVAGNVVDSVVLGSIEYAVEHLKCPLVVVLGHEKCGAVNATVDGGELPGSLPSIAKRIATSLNKVKGTPDNSGDITDKVINENALENATIVSSDHLIHELIETGKVKVVAGKYHLDSGKVDIL